ncbi:MAG: hypothetical protein II888_05415 [Clostridia bacterium]|nr:hypothetical protein [Clostridia bacterium]
MENERMIPEGEELDRELEKAYRFYQRNVRATEELVHQMILGARGDMPEEELLRQALQALEKCSFPENEG